MVGNFVRCATETQGTVSEIVDFDVNVATIPVWAVYRRQSLLVILLDACIFVMSLSIRYMIANTIPVNTVMFLNSAYFKQHQGRYQP